MRRVALILTLVAAGFSLTVAGTPAHAQRYPGKDYPPNGRQTGPGKQAETDRGRDAQAPARPVYERMTPEDRRQLRRDIDQHGREVYRGRKR